MTARRLAALAAACGLAVLAGHNAVAQNKYTPPTATAITPTAVTLAWSHPSQLVGTIGAVEQCATSTGPTNCGAPTVLAGGSGTGISSPYTVTGLTPDTTYYFRVGVPASLVALGIIASDVLTVMTEAAPAGGDAADASDEAVLPNALRDVTRGIHSGIYDRIRRRQQQDGRWE